jgi:hypothetical protein
MWVIGDFTSQFVENNDVHVVGYLAGTIKTKAGNSAPAFSARAMLKADEAAKMLKGHAGN